MFLFKPSTIPLNIYVVGCGGTGSRLIPMLAQFVRSITRSANPRGWLENPKIHLIDGDDVETKNLLRQNFVRQDVGKNKAVVLAQRYGRHFELDIAGIPIFVPNRFESPKSFNDAMHEREGRVTALNADFTSSNRFQPESADMVIMCVDNVEARRGIIDAFSMLSKRRNYGTVFIDAGNEDSFGQVKYFTSHILSSLYNRNSLPKETRLSVEPVEDVISFMPYPLIEYEKMVAGEGTGASCADLDQTLAINAAMAVNIMMIVQNYYYGKAMLYNEVSVSLDGSSFVKWNTYEDMYNRIVKLSDLPAGMPYDRSKVGFPYEPKTKVHTGITSTANYPELDFLFHYVKTQSKFKVPELISSSQVIATVPEVSLTSPDPTAPKRKVRRSPALLEPVYMAEETLPEVLVEVPTEQMRAATEGYFGFADEIMAETATSMAAEVATEVDALGIPTLVIDEDTNYDHHLEAFTGNDTEASPTPVPAPAEPPPLVAGINTLRAEAPPLTRSPR